ncbi:hypothetical protein BGY98DRAFT_1006895 [Russula aff. rugulosa BPL654]|nr:hypothetical protein BGY98DRAFT_1006895 [Russula aff. rugulosa BPL654]
MTQVAGRQNVNEPQPSNHLITSHYSNPMWRGTSRPGTCERATRGDGRTHHTRLPYTIFTSKPRGGHQCWRAHYHVLSFLLTLLLILFCYRRVASLPTKFSAEFAKQKIATCELSVFRRWARSSSVPVADRAPTRSAAALQLCQATRSQVHEVRYSRLSRRRSVRIILEVYVRH